MVKTIHLREGKLGLKNRLKTPVIILSFKDKSYVIQKIKLFVIFVLIFLYRNNYSLIFCGFAKKKERVLGIHP